jgi:predicted homoserine dehydrogenase-like protein
MSSHNQQVDDQSVEVAVIGTGVYGGHLAYHLSEGSGMKPTVLVDADLTKAVRTYERCGVDASHIVSTTDPAELSEALDQGARVATSDGLLAASSPVDVVIDATGDPEAAACHAWKSIGAGNDVVMVSVEVDATVGPLLSQYASGMGVAYSLAYGDEPAQVIELVDWARSSGFEVVAAGQGTELSFDKHGSHEDSLERYGVTDEFIRQNDPSPEMYNTFLDGTKVAIELCAAANATGLRADDGGMHMPVTDREGLLETLIPKSAGGALQRKGVIDAVTPSGYRNPSAFVITRVENPFTRRYLQNRYNILTSKDGEYQLFDRQFHLPQETLMSVENVAHDSEPTGLVRSQTAEVIARAKRDLKVGETLKAGADTIYGELVGADIAADAGWVPYELLSGARVREQVSTDQPISRADVKIKTDSVLFNLRQIQDKLGPWRADRNY